MPSAHASSYETLGGFMEQARGGSCLLTLAALSRDPRDFNSHPEPFTRLLQEAFGKPLDRWGEVAQAVASTAAEVGWDSRRRMETFAELSQEAAWRAFSDKDADPGPKTLQQVVKGFSGAEETIGETIDGGSAKGSGLAPVEEHWMEEGDSADIPFKMFLLGSAHVSAWVDRGATEGPNGLWALAQRLEGLPLHMLAFAADFARRAATPRTTGILSTRRDEQAIHAGTETGLGHVRSPRV